jgi:large repetitive protein
VFALPAEGWADATQTASLTASDGAAGDLLGASLAVYWNTIVAGAPQATVNGSPGAGAAYAFAWNARHWVTGTQSAKLVAPDPGPSAQLGASVSFQFETAVVGAPGQSKVAPGAGAAYQFSGAGSSWGFQAELTPSDASAGEEFGRSVAVIGTNILVGAPNVGVVYHFTRVGQSTTTETDKTTIPNGASDAFGSSLSLSGNTAIVGAVPTGGGPGAAYVLQLPLGTTPAFTSAVSTTVGMREPFDFKVTTSGDPSPAISESGTLPSGVTLHDNGDGTADLSGTPDAGTAGGYPISLTAVNAAGSATQQFTLTVSTAASSPSFTMGDSTELIYGQAGSFGITTDGFPAPKISKSGALPPGLTFTDEGGGVGQVSGTPIKTASGPYPVTFTAKNSAGSTSQSFTFFIDRAPTVAKIKDTTGTVGTALAVNVSATGWPAGQFGDPGLLPTGLTFTDHGDGTASITGTPSPGSGGASVITLTASNFLGSDSQSFTLTIDEPPTFTTANSASATVGSAFSFTAGAQGYPQPKITETGTLPAGVKFTAATATLAGTPKKNTAGTYPITLTATSKAGTTTQRFTLIVS